MLVGYSRVSTNDQSLDSQIDQLKKVGCERIFTDIVSGSKSERKNLTEMLDFVREGDTIVVCRLDRLGRGLKDLIDIITFLEKREINFKSISESMDTSTSTGKLLFHVAGAFAEFERNIIRERTNAGLASARARGRVGGRPKKMNVEQIQALKNMHQDKNISIKVITDTFGISMATMYNYLKKEKEKNNIL
ncbi:MAG: recombinase family protein [Endomicrobium sp.]|jgi:DNA invertase Pin-like site-specific DNA recombinase|nr:recombinase family protein [Endomicrobium sp.]